MAASGLLRFARNDEAAREAPSVPRPFCEEAKPTKQSRAASRRLDRSLADDDVGPGIAYRPVFTIVQSRVMNFCSGWFGVVTVKSRRMVASLG